MGHCLFDGQRAHLFSKLFEDSKRHSFAASSAYLKIALFSPRLFLSFLTLPGTLPNPRNCFSISY
jgi:hypothetical protein